MVDLTSPSGCGGRKRPCVAATPTQHPSTPQAFVPSKLSFEGAATKDSSYPVETADTKARSGNILSQGIHCPW